MVWEYVVGAVVLFFLSGLKVVKEYEKGVKFNLGKYVGLMKPGLKLVIPIIQSWQRVDMRVRATDVPEQESITKDNITVGINAVIYYKVVNAERAILEVEKYTYAVYQLAQTTMRNIVGETDLDEVLSNREKLSEDIKKIIDKASDPWGIQVDTVELKDITLAENMKRVMAKQAEAEREKRAVIIKADGEVTASKNMAKAASNLSKHDGALHLRTLQTLNGLSSDKSNTVVFAVPVDVLNAVGQNMGKNK
ncbi:MAG: SPFH domain-containing protein [Nanobdellota archaeon]